MSMVTSCIKFDMDAVMLKHLLNVRFSEVYFVWPLATRNILSKRKMRTMR